MLRWIFGSLALACAVSSQAFAQDTILGEKTFVVCRACHQIGPTAKNGVGPVLNGVIGRKAGTYEGFTYSKANRESGITWDEPTLEKYLTSPAAVVPGTKMIFAGIRDPGKVEAVIAYLKQYASDGTRTQ